VLLFCGNTAMYSVQSLASFYVDASFFVPVVALTDLCLEGVRLALQGS